MKNAAITFLLPPGILNFSNHYRMSEIRPITRPGTHERFIEFFREQVPAQDVNVLDLGAGHGAFTKRLHERGYQISAADLFPEYFLYDHIECRKVDMAGIYPYPDQTFDVVIVIEVSEHLLNHEIFFSEACRILKPGGSLLLSTPNILSLKSRFRFLIKGHFYSFGPLEMNNYNGLQHVASLTLDQYNYVATKNGFEKAIYEIDKEQKTSRFLSLLMFPLLWLTKTAGKEPSLHNNQQLLLGHKLFMNFRKSLSLRK